MPKRRRVEEDDEAELEWQSDAATATYVADLKAAMRIMDDDEHFIAS